jgi:hypothetical protein
MAAVVERAAAASRWLKNRLVRLNLFESDHYHSNAFHLRTAIISTRVYIVLIILAITILVVWSAVGNQTEIITIRNPSQTTYEDLYSEYLTTLSCQCRRTAIPFDTFISVSAQYHPICSSFFVSDTWINLLFNSNIGYYIQIDFRSSSSGQFQLLSSLCSLAKRTIHDAVDDFLSSTLLTVNVLSSQLLEIQSQTQSMSVRTSSAAAVDRLVDLIRDTNQNNRLQPALQTTGMNVLYIFPDGQVTAATIDGCFIETDGYLCCCYFTYHCSSPSSFFDLYAYETEGMYVSSKLPMVNVTGFMTGCYAIESLLKSTLECLFDQICVYTLLSFFPTSNITNIDVLLVNQTKFPPNTLFETLINELFIEQWSTVSSFSAYYNICAPISCTYIRTRRNDVVYVLITLIGLYGGLAVVLRFCVPCAIRWWRNRFNRSIGPNTSMLSCRIKNDEIVFFF